MFWKKKQPPIDKGEKIKARDLFDKIFAASSLEELAQVYKTHTAAIEETWGSGFVLILKTVISRLDALEKQVKELQKATNSDD